MKRRTMVKVLLITILLSVMGCAQYEAVRKNEGVVQAVSQKNMEPRNDAQSQPKTSASAATSGADAKAKQLSSAGSSADSQQMISAQQSTPAGVVYFELDSYVLTNESVNALQAIFKKLESRPFIQVEGHCDEQGSSEYNLALGEKRAKAAQNYLVTLGYPADKISIISYGKERPADKGHDGDAWAKNRRDELKIVK
jgi:peptidoglycan-associated lipoprotein